MDWNWLYSSLSQSIAAIVGFIGSFIITKIISNQSIYKVNVEKLSEYISISNSFKEKINNRYFDWYNRNIREREIDNLKDELEKNGITRSSAEYYDYLKFSIFYNRGKIIHEIDDIIRNYKIKKENELKKTGFFGPKASLKTPRFNTNALNEERESIDNLIIEIKHHIQIISNFINDIRSNPQSSKLILWSIIIILVLFYIGVIIPLSLLPIDNNNPNILNLNTLISIKGVILLLVSFFFTLIMTIFIIINNINKYKKEDIEKLKLFLELENYSDYLKAYVINKKHFDKQKKH